MAWTEAADRSHNPITLDAGQELTVPALTGLPTNTLSQTLADSPAITKAILKMTALTADAAGPGGAAGETRRPACRCTRTATSR